MRIQESIDVNLSIDGANDFINTKEAKLYISHYVIYLKSGSSFYRHFEPIGSLPVKYGKNAIRIPTTQEDTTLLLKGPLSMEIREATCVLKWSDGDARYSVGFVAKELKSSKPVLIVDLI